ncbi:MAG TPA: hypothetical protein IGS52_06590 [Oscillatoriaceae cyanobacterium M33_DOE_052]|uniref:Uncharacterized protein n=1 Tax=Planktothricoides sp. SpSt-374 TaxID=2282167 RepID=A0A7C3ZGP7_9CYAN|nr:hypothetical protein [Oscillatoriaceae cyanobacterium M33_DOE_052]
MATTLGGAKPDDDQFLGLAPDDSPEGFAPRGGGMLSLAPSGPIANPDGLAGLIKTGLLVSGVSPALTNL